MSGPVDPRDHVQVRQKTPSYNCLVLVEPVFHGLDRDECSSHVGGVTVGGKRRRRHEERG